jgi:hypothetical protein
MCRPRRRDVLAGAAGLFGASIIGSADVEAAVPNPERIARLRALMAQAGGDPKSDDDMDATCDKFDAVAEDVWDDPAEATVNLLELALVAFHYWADRVGEDGRPVMALEDGGLQARAAKHLIAATLEMLGAPEADRYV